MARLHVLGCLALLVGAGAQLDDEVILMQQSFQRHVVPGGLIVPLDVQHAKRPWQGVSSKTESTFYTANLTVGYPPQKFKFLVDTGSGFVLLPHQKCKQKACNGRRKYSQKLSTFAEEVFSNGTRVNFSQSLATGRHQSIRIPFNVADLGNGYARGPCVRDRVCMSDSNDKKVCARPVMVTALKMDEVPFGFMPGDGILGLSLSGLSLDSNKNFLDNLILSDPRLKPQFGISFGSNGGELHVGGYDPTVVASPLLWFPVFKPEEGQWQVLISSVKVGGRVIDACEKGCRAVVDSGTSRVGVQDSSLKDLEAAVAALSPGSRSDSGACRVPELSFDLGGMEIVLGADDYTNENCEPDLGNLELEEAEYAGVYTFGAQVLYKYFVAFDWKDNMVGFAATTGAKREVGQLPAVEQTFV